MLTVGTAHLRALAARLRTDDGAGIVEYVLLILAIALVVLVAMQLLGDTLSNTFGDIANDVEDA